jgi:hypothetical protein
VSKVEFPQERLRQNYPQIRGFHFVSSTTGDVRCNGQLQGESSFILSSKGIDLLLEKLLEATLQESYMGEQVPKVYLQFEQAIVR